MASVGGFAAVDRNREKIGELVPKGPNSGKFISRLAGRAGNAINRQTHSACG